jgi:putative heme-binding domain-containing protein
MIWFGVEPLVAVDAKRALELARRSRLPLVAKFLARRAVDANAFAEMVSALDGLSNPEAMLAGMRDGLSGRRDLKVPPGWRELSLRLVAQGGEVSRLVNAISQQLGMRSASELILELASDGKKSPEERREAIRSLAVQQDQRLVPALPDLLQDEVVRVEAIRAIAAFDRPQLGELLLRKYEQFSASEKQEVVQTLASRPQYGAILTKALKNDKVPRRDVPSYVARQLRRVVGNGFMEVWGLVDELPENKEAAFRRYRQLLHPDALGQADLKKGRVLFQRQCMACHQLHGEGGKLGPDITGANRASLDYLLDNILDPSGVIQDDYKMVMVTTRDGRTLAGNVVGENDRQLTLRIVGQEVVLAKADVQSREVSPVSMMPEGILQNLKDEEVIDLMAYLQTMKSPKEDKN